MQMAVNAARGAAGLRLPTDVSLEKSVVEGGVIFAFRHRSLGLLGRLTVQETRGGQVFLRGEVAGDPQDPATGTRREILEPITRELMERVDRGLGRVGRGPAALDEVPGPLPSSGEEWVKSRVLLCENCERKVAHLILVPPGTEEPGGFEDYARKMYSVCAGLDLPAWILGPVDEARGMCPVMKVWPERTPLEHLTEAQFDALLAPLVRHC